MIVTEEVLDKARKTCLLPMIVQEDPTLAQVTFDFSLIVSLLMCLFFFPFLSYLVFIQTQNFMLNETTNTRFSRHRKSNVSEEAIARLADFETSEDGDSEQGLANGNMTPPSMRSRTTRMTSLDGAAPSAGCVDNCSNMFCGPGHFKKQERIIKKFTKDPNVQVNQLSTGSDTARLLSGLPDSGRQAVIGQRMSESYAKRQMFYYQVDDARLAGFGAQQPTPQQLLIQMENASPTLVPPLDSSVEGEEVATNAHNFT